MPSPVRKVAWFQCLPVSLHWREDSKVFPACWILIGRFKFPARQPYARGSIDPSKYNGWKCWKLLQAILNVSYIYLPQGTSRACLVTNLTLIAIVVKFVHEVSRFHSYSPHAAFCWPVTIVCLTSGCSGPALSVIFQPKVTKTKRIIRNSCKEYLVDCYHRTPRRPCWPQLFEGWITLSTA